MNIVPEKQTLDFSRLTERANSLRPFGLASTTAAAVCLGLLLQVSALGAERHATPVTSIRVKEGFQVELLRSAQQHEGSWISMTFEGPRSIILGGDASGLLRLTIGATPAETTVEPLAGAEKLKHCRGVLYAHQSLYCCETNGEGIHRLQDRDGDGVYEAMQLLCPLEYGSRYGHGANQIRLGPDGMLYIAIGNDVRFPEKRDPESPYRNYQNDWLLPNPADGEPDDRVGYILKMDPEGKTFTVLAGGMRNQVDVAFNPEGEMFTWDADMEWDIGLPWYRPTRLNHIVSAGEYGWRWGTGKWPAWFPDSLPTTFDTGLSSPAGLASGTASTWPGRFRQALYGADWQNGRLLMFDLLENGASYAARSEVLAEGSPLNICDLEFGPDGALYFITGGRGSQSGLYRITRTVGADDTVAQELKRSPEAAAARAVRRQLETLHVRKDASQLSLIWSHLDSDDAWLRFAARLALENQPVESWRQRVASEPDSKARHTALMALARVGTPEDQPTVLEGLKQWDFAASDPDELLWGLRTLQLSSIRQKAVTCAEHPQLARAIEQLPSSDRFAVNWLRSELLVAMKSSMAVDEIVRQLNAAGTQEEQVQFVKTLLRVESGWSPEARETVLNWLIQNKQLPGGRLVTSVLESMRKEFEQSLSTDDRTRLKQQLALLLEPPKEASDSAVLSQRPLVDKWTVEKLYAELAALDLRKASVENGRKVLAESLCLRCHQLGDRGAHIGPDLTTVGKRMDRRALLESILEPSRQIDPKYHNATYLLEDGRVVTGRTTSVSRSQIGLETDPLAAKVVTIARAEIVESRVSSVSPMPEGLLDTFTVEEVRDLLSYLQSFGGR
jgi:putative heme-binding domain-containing protein